MTRKVLYWQSIDRWVLRFSIGPGRRLDKVMPNRWQPTADLKLAVLKEVTASNPARTVAQTVTTSLTPQLSQETFTQSLSITPVPVTPFYVQNSAVERMK